MWRPIDLSDTAALAAVRNEKTQHRVPVRAAPELLAARDVVIEVGNAHGDWIVQSRSLKRSSSYFGPPLGGVGTSVWGRESFQTIAGPPGGKWQTCVIYRADGAVVFLAGQRRVNVRAAPPPPADKWRASAHMPIACSRAFYVVTGVYRGRLHDMGAEELRAEGLPDVDTFAREWNIRHRGHYAWRENPWVLVTTLKRDRRGPV